jgi:hypothetical protein
VERYLTLVECAEELRTTKPVIIKLIKRKILTAIEITPKHYRILDPGPNLRELFLDPKIERIPFVSMHEAADILGMNFRTLRWYVDIGRLHAARFPHGPEFKVITVKELRRFAADRERRHGPGKKIYSRAIVNWLKKYLAGEVTPNAEVLADMIHRAMRIQEPRRSQVICEFWALIDRANELLEEASGIQKEQREPKPPL